MDTTTEQETSQLVQDAIAQGEGRLSTSGAIAVETGEFTGRSPRDKYIVDEPGSTGMVWWGDVNHPMPEETFDAMAADVGRHLASRQVWRESLAVGADTRYRYPVQLTTERAWVALFSRHLFIVPAGEQLDELPIRILHAPTYRVDPDRFATRSSTVIAIHPTRRTILIAGTEYAGEVKKAVFSLMQYLLPQRGVATMHCSAAIAANGDSALFFGLSGTGKTTLSNDPTLRLVGDDEHGWSKDGIFNLEGGCYAKVINLSEAAEPSIYAAANQPGAVWENVVVSAEGEPDFSDRSLTENMRAAFPLSSLPRTVATGTGPAPSRIILLTADASGVLPPVARLNREQAMGWFLLGFTSKIAGTERGLTEPEMTFSPTFGEPFLTLPPARYAELLKQRIDETGPSLWLVNTGWMHETDGPTERIPLGYTRAIVRSIVEGKLDHAEFAPAGLFDLMIPKGVAGVPHTLLNPRGAWADQAAYRERAQRLRKAFARQAAASQIPVAWLEWLDGEIPE